MRTRSATTPHEARTAILAIWVWRVRRKRRKWRFSDLLLAAVSGTSHDRTAKTAKKAILAISVWRAYMPQWTANLTILARNSRKDSKARSAANQPLPSDWRFCKCGLVIPRWLPTRFAQTLIEESGEQNKKGDFGDHKIPSPPFTKPPLYPSRNLKCVANNLVAQNDRIPCRQKQTFNVGPLTRWGFREQCVASDPQWFTHKPRLYAS